ncbi:helix-turn-helix transcriptional regulator [Vibrio sp. 16]|uniref:helix-turn-helix transcriptional regulator n=1 Tax=Vibrio sp. 16 TaxID=391586 RepID=UPI00018F3DAA|nr:hypothetical protein [Vibrio sp. 16]EED27586.1 putative transcriptional regulator [Vibrio sp. 16]CAK4070599.1 hypothetical protein VDT1_2550 [Vibrio sp. 16]HCE1504458.1 transcriptional regulator [Vibrio parahaemolyticus]
MGKTRYYDYSRAMTQEAPTKIVTKKQLAQETGKSLSTIGRMIKDGRVPEPLRTPRGNTGGWFRATINKWLEEQETQ